MDHPQLPELNTSRRSVLDSDGHRVIYRVVDRVQRQQSMNGDKYVVLERLKFDADGRYELRLGWYYFRRDGRWHWGQTATMIPPTDLKQLIHDADRKGWFGG
jgi:hypothetical protein